MADIAEKQTDGTHPFDPRIQSENLAFDSREMIACGGCGRMNPPNRPTCFYCARELEITSERAAAFLHVKRRQ